MLKTLKRYKKVGKKDKYLKLLVEAYSSPWAKKRGTFRDHERSQSQRDMGQIWERFENDVQQISRYLLSIVDVENWPSQPVLEAVFKLVVCNDGGISDETFRQSLTALDLQSEKAANARSAALPSERDVAHAFLRQLFDPALIVFQYDYDFIDDVVPIIESRYIGENGCTNPKQSERFLKALWLLCGESLENYDVSVLSRRLRSLLGDKHPFKPTRYEMRRELEKHLSPPVADEFIHLRCEDDPERYVEICAELFRSVNDKATDQYEERDISLIYGYENNYHLILRTLINLMNEGKLTADDEVLIIGPRYADEVMFFRNILGLPKTIGLDLRDEGDVLVAGDMHRMPFESNRFKLVFGASVIEYAYDVHQVVSEIARVLKRPGYMAGISRSNRSSSPSPTGRTDVGSVEAVTNLYYRYPHAILARDPGLTSDPDAIGNFPSYVVELT